MRIRIAMMTPFYILIEVQVQVEIYVQIQIRIGIHILIQEAVFGSWG